MSASDRAEERLAEDVACWSRAAGCPVEPRPGILHERAALLGLPEPGRVSRNGSCRIVRARDGWLAVNLPRPEDRAMTPALLEEETEDAWAAIEAALPQRSVAGTLARARLLGLAVTALGETSAPPAARAEAGDARPWMRPPRVVDLSALWAGPLCGGLLAEAGCDVLKVESRRRPDTTAGRSPVFDALLNGGKRRWVMDGDDPGDRARLADLIGRADVVITSARPRSLTWLPDLLRRTCCWIAIQAHRDGDRIGFGDDCAVAGGLVAFAQGAPHFLGDAVADPLTGLTAAAVAFRALALREGGRHPVELATVAARAAHG
ncbi:CoA transferase [Aquibium microcysteis]|uniref:CoA transferase n=1 Tax=Aquibium microcysteis TaxID=675281 RepID=UPI00165CFA94|nr:CoA transferase [Aquibium microcysteis]